ISICYSICFFFFFSSRRRHTRSKRDWSSDVCSSDLVRGVEEGVGGSSGDRCDDAPAGRDPGYAEDPGGEQHPHYHSVGQVRGCRSEERRVGKEWRNGWSQEKKKKKEKEREKERV